MSDNNKKAALDYHRLGRPGKIETLPTKPYSSQHDLSLAYSPGVAYPCLEIKDRAEDAYEYTNKGNLMAVISNGTAVLGLGDIGALAGKPVMEGKALLFKIFAGLDCYDIELNEKDPEKFIAAVKAIAPTFGGINLRRHRLHQPLHRARCSPGEHRNVRQQGSHLHFPHRPQRHEADLRH